MNSVKLNGNNNELEMRLKSLTSSCKKLRAYYEITSALMEPVKALSIEGNINLQKWAYGVERVFSENEELLKEIVYDSELI